MKIELIVFDFDGTLVDTRKDLAEAMNFALKETGLSPISEEKVWRYTGDGTPLLVQRVLKEKGRLDLTEKLTELFLSYYEEHYADYATPIKGAKETLERLSGRGKKMAVLSNKYERFVVKLLKKFGMAKYFFAVYGKDSFEKSKPDPYPLFKIVSDANAKKEETAFVGDSKNDVLIAKNAGVACFIIPSGATPISELKKLGPFVLLNGIEELEKYIE